MPNLSSATMTRAQVPVQKVGVSERIDLDTLRNVRVYQDVEDATRSLLLSMEAKVLAGPEETIEVVAEAEFETVDSVWAAVCVYWFVPMFVFLYTHIGWEWLYKSYKWARSHKTYNVEMSRQTKTMSTKMCPHIAVPDNQTHVEFLIEG